jgi:phosphopantetheine adenylyltransferase
MSYVYDDFGNLKNNCLTVKPISKPINIRGLRTDANWSITAINYDTKNNINSEVDCVFWTKKEALNFLKTGVHKCSVNNQTLYQIK